MARSDLMRKLSAAGLPATIELGDGTWAHSPQYIKASINGLVSVVGRKKATEIENKEAKEFASFVAKLTTTQRAEYLKLMQESERNDRTE